MSQGFLPQWKGFLFVYCYTSGRCGEYFPGRTCCFALSNSRLVFRCLNCKPIITKGGIEHIQWIEYGRYYRLNGINPFTPKKWLPIWVFYVSNLGSEVSQWYEKISGYYWGCFMYHQITWLGRNFKYLHGIRRVLIP